MGRSIFFWVQNGGLYVIIYIDLEKCALEMRDKG